MVSNHVVTDGSLRVRASRDGDRFHYVWAACQLLKLLKPDSQLRQISIEGIDLGDGHEEYEEDEVIDLVEYYGPSDGSITSIDIQQLKYSTLHPEKNISPKEFGSILKKFLSLHEQLLRAYPDVDFSFSIITNRGISPAVANVVRQVDTIAGDKLYQYFSQWMPGQGFELSSIKLLIKKLTIKDRQANIGVLRGKLESGINDLASGIDVRLAANIVDLVASRASTESNGPIRRQDVLSRWGCCEEDLLPAPSLLEKGDYVIRDSYRNLAGKILDTPSPLIVSGGAGVGKSTFARSLPQLLADKAEVVVFDCFGGGTYRCPGSKRHTHNIAYVQIVTELAALGLTLPLIPDPRVSNESYNKKFLDRLKQASKRLKELDNRELVILIDAADNAVIAAEESPREGAFVEDLLALDLTGLDNIHIVFTCRPERIRSLSKRVSSTILPLPEYSQAEVHGVLEGKYRTVDRADAIEIATLLSGNPRLLALYMKKSNSLKQLMNTIAGTDSKTDVIGELISRNYKETLDNSGIHRQRIEKLAQLLTVLPPSIPISVLSEVTALPEEAIRSFIADLGAGFHLSNDSIRFIDEPTETFFRDKFYPSGSDFSDVISSLREMSENSTYAAAALPELLWVSESYDELLDLAESESLLSEMNSIQRSELDRIRVEFGIRAAFALKRPLSVLKLFVRVGRSLSTREAFKTIVENNPLIAAPILRGRILNELIASRVLTQSWPGSTLATESLLLAWSSQESAVARNRTRQAKDAIRSWSSLENESPGRFERVSSQQISHLVLAILKVDGHEEAARYVNSWSCTMRLFEVGRIVAEALLVANRIADLELLLQSVATPSFIFGCASELQRFGSILKKETVVELSKIIEEEPGFLKGMNYISVEIRDLLFRGAVWVFQLTCEYKLSTRAELEAKIKSSFLKEHARPLLRGNVGYQFGNLLYVTLLCALSGREIDVQSLNSLSGEIDTKTNEVIDGKFHRIVPLLRIWVSIVLGNPDMTYVKTYLNKFSLRVPLEGRADYVDRYILELAAFIMRMLDDKDVEILGKDILKNVSDHSPIEGIRYLLPGLNGDCRFSRGALELALSAKMQAEEFNSPRLTTDWYVYIAQSLYSFSEAEASCYLEEAIKSFRCDESEAYDRLDMVFSMAPSIRTSDRSTRLDLSFRIAKLAETIIPDTFYEVEESKIVEAIGEIAGPSFLQILSSWRERRFGSIGRFISCWVNSSGSLLEGRLDLGLILAPFMENKNASRVIENYEKNTLVDDDTRESVVRFGYRMGALRYRGVDSYPAQLVTETELNVGNSRTCSSNFCENIDELGNIGSIRDADLTDEETMKEIIICQRTAGREGFRAFVEGLFSYPELKWASIFDTILRLEMLDYRELKGLLSHALAIPSSTLSFKRSFQDALVKFIERFSNEIFLDPGVQLDFRKASIFSGTDLSYLRNLALGNLEIMSLLQSHEDCYRFCSSFSRLLDPGDVEKLLRSTIESLERDYQFSDQDLSKHCGKNCLDVSLARFIVSALGDPREEIRWKAAHAVRVAIAIKSDKLVSALNSCIAEPKLDGYIDERFTFYRMHSVLWYLFAVERASREVKILDKSFFRTLRYFDEEYPDHFLVQDLCFRIALQLDEESVSNVGTNWSKLLRNVKMTDNFRSLPTHPICVGSAETEFPFEPDFDHFYLGGLTNSFNLSHQFTLDQCSSLILDSWGWGAKNIDLIDSRALHHIYENSETHAFKSNIPSTHSLKYYLQFHALLTMAGKFLKTYEPLQYSYSDCSEIEQLLYRFNLSRKDRRWISDQRRPIPLSIRQYIVDDDERSYSSLLSEDRRWTIVWQESRFFNGVKDYQVNLFSSLVNANTASSLVNALQCSDSYMSFRLPSADPCDQEFNFSKGPFDLRGWISTGCELYGIDEGDWYSGKLRAFLPEPAQYIIEQLDLEPFEGGQYWKDSETGEKVFIGEMWDSLGDSTSDLIYGRRLKISTEALNRLLLKNTQSLVVEVQNRSNSYLEESKNGDDCEFGKGYRVFSYSPTTGWQYAIEDS